MLLPRRALVRPRRRLRHRPRKPGRRRPRPLGDLPLLRVGTLHHRADQRRLAPEWGHASRRPCGHGLCRQRRPGQQDVRQCSVWFPPHGRVAARHRRGAPLLVGRRLGTHGTRLVRPVLLQQGRRRQGLHSGQALRDAGGKRPRGHQQGVPVQYQARGQPAEVLRQILRPRLGVPPPGAVRGGHVHRLVPQARHTKERARGAAAVQGRSQLRGDRAAEGGADAPGQAGHGGAARGTRR
mmetsp:Transcript_76577/g.234445  ORF Transcript_76577/g.234445 Transcript_76577/m.234445 type:complete len:238 (-) Transcript_76577:209-922(-)